MNRNKRKREQATLLTKTIAILLSCAFIFTSVPTAAIAEANAEGDVSELQDSLVDEGYLGEEDAIIEDGPESEGDSSFLEEPVVDSAAENETETALTVEDLPAEVENSSGNSGDEESSLLEDDLAFTSQTEGDEQEVEAQARSLMVVIYRTGECKVGYDLSTSNSLYYYTNLGTNIDCSRGVYPWSATEYDPSAPQNRITKITFTDDIKVLSASCMFEGTPNLVSADLSKLDVSECTDFRWMFAGCSKLEALDMSGWRVSGYSLPATDMYRDCTSLQSVKVGSGFKWCTKLPSTSINGHTDWYSTKDGRWYTASEIYNNRDNIADTYTKTGPSTRDISTSTCTATINTQAWTGKQVKPAVTVKWGATTLVKGTDYQVVSYGTNKNNGTANNWVKIQGMGSYAGSRTVGFRIRKPNVLYYVHRQTYGWEEPYSKSNGQQSGTTGQSKRLEGIYVKLSNKPAAGTIEYRTHIQTYGWEENWRSAGQMSGTMGKSKRLEAIQVRLTGNMAKKYDVWYRVHAQHFGWMGWAKNGEQAGTAGYSYRLESIQIVLLPKGSDTPAETYMGASCNCSSAFMDASVPALVYKFKRDTWSFSNYSTNISKASFQRMYGNAKGEELYNDTDYGYAGGVCYGFSTSVGSIVKHKYPTESSFNTSSVYQIGQNDHTSMLDMEANDFIEYCFLMQYDYRLLNEMFASKNNYSGLVDAVMKHQSGGTAIEIDLMGPRGGHSVFPIKISVNNTSKTVIDIYDNNRPTALQTLTLWKNSSGRYTGFTYSADYGYTWVAWETPADNVESFMAGNAIYDDNRIVESGLGSRNMSLIRTDTDLTVVSGGKTYKLSPSAKNDSNLVVPVLCKGSSTNGNLYWVGFDTGDMVVKSLAANASFSVTCNNAGVQVNAKKGATVKMSVSDDAKNSVSVKGKKGDAYEITYRTYSGTKVTKTTTKGIVK